MSRRRAASSLAVDLSVWSLMERSLSVSSIQTTRTELCYWVAVLVSKTLGTALGDYLAVDSRLGFLGGAALIGAPTAVTAATSRITRLNRVMLFWVAFARSARSVRRVSRGMRNAGWCLRSLGMRASTSSPSR